MNTYTVGIIISVVSVIVSVISLVVSLMNLDSKNECYCYDEKINEDTLQNVNESSAKNVYSPQLFIKTTLLVLIMLSPILSNYLNHCEGLKSNKQIIIRPIYTLGIAYSHDNYNNHMVRHEVYMIDSQLTYVPIITSVSSENDDWEQKYNWKQIYDNEYEAASGLFTLKIPKRYINIIRGQYTFIYFEANKS